MKYIVVDGTEENCFLADSEDEISAGLRNNEWDIEECLIYERGSPLEFEIKLVRKSTVVRKEK